MAKRGKNKQKPKPAAAVAEAAAQAPAVAGQSAVPDEAGLPQAQVGEAPATADVEHGRLEAGGHATPPEAADGDAVESSRPRPKGRRKASQPSRDRRSPFLVLAEYEQRSLAHVAGLPEQLDAPGLWRGVAYRVGAHRLASGFDEVVEILSMPPLTPVPGAQAWLLGVANVRGTLLPVVDLKQFLEGERTVIHESQRVLVVRQPGGDVAITIDELYGQRSFTDAQGIASGASAPGRYAYFIDRAYRINDHDWGVFSLDRLARTPEFRQAAA